MTTRSVIGLPRNRNHYPVSQTSLRKARRLAEEFNTAINKMRYVIERAITHFKTWRCMHTDYRRSKRTYVTAFSAVRALHFFTLRFSISLTV